MSATVDQPELEQVLARLDADADGALERLKSVLRIPSVSADPARSGACVEAAEWFRDALACLGFKAALRQTAGHPVVLAHHPGPRAGGPHILLYGHYDVQPAEPLALWTSPPFEPVVVAGPHGDRLVARGAVDDKGQSLMWLEALRAWHDVSGGPPLAVTVLIEGEEEIGSVNLEPFLAANRDELRADFAVISDTGMWDIDTPGITTRLRGLVYTEVRLRAAERDLHSGLFGGSALNPINALTRMLGGLHDADGRIALPGFYDGVADISPAQARQWESLGFAEDKFLGGIGLSVPVGERGRSPLERLWARPTADINGIWGGYQGPGSKTVIPAEAGAKISFRLVPGQRPEAVLASLRAFLDARKPADATVSVEVFAGSPGLEIAADRPWLAAARGALAAEYGRPAVLMGSGGSIPVVEGFSRVLGLESLLMGFGLDDDQVHSPNEKFELRCFRKGARSHARLFSALAG